MDREVLDRLAKEANDLDATGLHRLRDELEAGINLFKEEGFQHPLWMLFQLNEIEIHEYDLRTRQLPLWQQRIIAKALHGCTTFTAPVMATALHREGPAKGVVAPAVRQTVNPAPATQPGRWSDGALASAPRQRVNTALGNRTSGNDECKH